MKRLIKIECALLILICITITLTLAATQHICSAKANSPESFLLPEIKTDHPVITNVDVLLDVGHGGIDGGTSFGDLLEKDINLSIAKKTYDSLQRNGFVVLMNRMDDYALSGENLWLRSQNSLNMLYDTHEEPVYGKTYYLLKHSLNKRLPIKLLREFSNISKRACPSR
jgi:N-acetylmuramoyl-L-alanine amidase